MLIEIELRDATAADRDHWMSLLATVDADQVPYLLSARRRAAAGREKSTRPSESSTSAEEQRSAVPSGRAAPTNRVAYRPTQVNTAADTNPTPIGLASPRLPTDPQSTSLSADAEPAPTTAPVASGRRWMAPLRGRWGDSRDEPTEAEAVARVEVEPPRSSPGAPESPEGHGSAYMNVELQRVMSLLRAELQEAEESEGSGDTLPDDARRRMEIQLRLLHLLANEPEQALRVIPDLPAEQQEFWVQLLWTVANELNPPPGSDEGDRLRKTLKQLREAERHLQQATPLTISKAWFCYRIDSFGSYERFTQDVFRPGQPVLVYAELENFESELTAGNSYRTRLRTTLEIFPVDEAGNVSPSALPVDRKELAATEDLCRSVRRDYFHSYRLDIPSQLPPGRYVLRLTMLDELSRKSATTEMPFALQ